MASSTLQSVSARRRLSLALSALRHRNYRLYWFGQLASVLAQNMEYVAQSWLVLELTNSPLLLGLTGLSSGDSDDHFNSRRRRHRRPRRPPPHHDRRPIRRRADLFHLSDLDRHRAWSRFGMS